MASGKEPPDSARATKRRQLRHVVGQVVGQEPPYVPEGGAAQLDRHHDRPEVVIEQDQVGRLAGGVGATAPHRHPDVGLA